MNEHLEEFRVLHVVSSTDRRGAETAAVELSNALAGLGLRGEVVALVRGEQGGLEVPVLGPSRFHAQTLRRLRRRAGEVAVVVAHGSSTLPATAVATLGASTPFVYRSIGDPRAWAATPARRARVALAARRAAGLIALWRDAAVAWHTTYGVRADRITVIPNGVPAQNFEPASLGVRREERIALGLPEDGPVVLYLGALSREKRVDLAIRAVSALDRVTLAVVGDGPERERLSSLAAADPAGRTRVLGPTSEPWRALAAADALVLPSDTEGQPAVAIEAGLMGIPVVATRVGGLPEIVLDGRSGELVETGDAAALTQALRRALARPLEYRDAARAHCLESFSLGPISEKWARFLQSVIKSGAIPEQHRP